VTIQPHQRLDLFGRMDYAFPLSGASPSPTTANPMVSQAMQTIDVHAHILSEETIRLMQREAPTVGPRLSNMGERFASLDVAGNIYRQFPRGGWDLEQRLQDMAAAKVDAQVLSVCPQTFLYGQPAPLAAALARIQNEELAKLAKVRPDRFLAIATLPMQAPEQAADELRHAVRTLGLRGAQIGSNIAGKNLDDPEFEPVWATAAELDAFILLHPINVAGADRLSSYYLTNLIGNPLDTTIAAACLVFSGVLERHPKLQICLAHGGGFVPYQAGRFIHGWHVREEPKRRLAEPPTQSLKRFYFDTIVHSKEVLAFLVGNAGAERVLLGSDYPFDMGMPHGVSQVRSLSISATDQAAILGGRARALLDKVSARAFA
jgi:aminocarboxymuconate-semialdehyde decarboxylase